MRGNGSALRYLAAALGGLFLAATVFQVLERVHLAAVGVVLEPAPQRREAAAAIRPARGVGRLAAHADLRVEGSRPVFPAQEHAAPRAVLVGAVDHGAAAATELAHGRRIQMPRPLSTPRE